MRLAIALALVLIGLLACGGRGSSAPAAPDNRDARPAEGATPAAGLPAEVLALVERWEACQHWAGEEPYDAERAADIRAGVEQSCPGNEAERDRLRVRYADWPDVIERLRPLE